MAAVAAVLPELLREVLDTEPSEKTEAQHIHYITLTLSELNKLSVRLKCRTLVIYMTVYRVIVLYLRM